MTVNATASPQFLGKKVPPDVLGCGSHAGENREFACKPYGRSHSIIPFLLHCGTTAQPRPMLNQTATKIRAGFDNGEFTAEEITRNYLDRISQYDDRVGAFLDADAEQALADAKQADQRRAAGKTRGPLDGIPVAVKDVLCTSGRRTTCASKMLEQFQPPYESTVTGRLKAAGAVLLGKTNMDEFAMGGSTENSALGSTRNPWSLDCVPGGSSGGSAACLAALMAPLSIGSDTGGSIRQPAAFCGVVGLKPTYGRVSRYGLVAFASSLDQVGPMARTAEDAAMLLEAISGHDPLDSTSANLPVPNYTATVRQPLKGLKLGVVREHFGEGLEPEVAQAIEESIAVFRSCGATIHDVEMPHSKYGVATYYIIAPCEASSNLARYDGVHYGYRDGRHRSQRRIEATMMTAPWSACTAALELRASGQK